MHLWFEPSLRHLFTEVLTLEGYAIEEVRTSAEALDLCGPPGERCVVLKDNYHLNEQAVIFARTVFARPDLHAHVRIVGVNMVRWEGLQEIDEFIRLPFSIDEFLDPIAQLSADLQADGS